MTTECMDYVELPYLFDEFFVILVRRLFEGGVYSRAVFIRGRRLFEGGVYPRAAYIRERRLSEGGVYSKAAFV